MLTPFEKNLEVWRQLWRVLERSHIVVQVRFVPSWDESLPHAGWIASVGLPQALHVITKGSLE